eukprot:gene27171-2411_t
MRACLSVLLIEARHPLSNLLSHWRLVYPMQKPISRQRLTRARVVKVLETSARIMGLPPFPPALPPGHHPAPAPQPTPAHPGPPPGSTRGAHPLGPPRPTLARSPLSGSLALWLSAHLPLYLSALLPLYHSFSLSMCLSASLPGCLSASLCGSLFTWGLPESRIARKGSSTDVPDQALHDLQVVSMGCSRHSAIATAEGHVWTMGHNNSKGGGGHGSQPIEGSGQMGRVGAKDAGRVTLTLEGLHVVQAITGRYHSLAVTSDGDVYTWGLNDWGQLGRATRGATSEDDPTPCVMGYSCHDVVPQKVEKLSGIKIVGATAGRYNTYALDDAGALYAWGLDGCSNGGDRPAQGEAWIARKIRGQLDGKQVVAFDAGEIMMVKGELEGKHVTAVAAGREHALVVTKEGKYFSLAASGNMVYGWGDNGYLTAGVGRNNPVQTLKEGRSTGPVATPAKVRGPLGTGSWRILGIAAANKIARSAEATSAAVDHFGYMLAQLSIPKYNTAKYWEEHKPNATVRHELMKVSADAFQGLPQKLDAKFCNPCWYSGTTLRCIPFYHILGVSKCGTTDLYYRMSLHPDIYQSRNKGPHFWDECIWPPKGACTVPPNGDFDGYVDLFQDAAKKIENNPRGITGDASSNTYTGAKGVYLRGFKGNQDVNVSITDLLWETSPFLRLMVIFRNPVDRYYSAYWYYRRGNKDPSLGPDHFHDLTVSEIEQWKSCLDARGATKCLQLYHPQQLVKGMYSEFFEDWLAKFPRDQILFLRNEDYQLALREHLEVIFQFL